MNDRSNDRSEERPADRSFTRDVEILKYPIEKRARNKGIRNKNENGRDVRRNEK